MPKPSGGTITVTHRTEATERYAEQAASATGAGSRQYCPMKSRLPISMPAWRSSAYVVVTWKKNCGSP